MLRGCATKCRSVSVWTCSGPVPPPSCRCQRKRGRSNSVMEGIAKCLRLGVEDGPLTRALNGAFPIRDLMRTKPGDGPRDTAADLLCMFAGAGDATADNTPPPPAAVDDAASACPALATAAVVVPVLQPPVRRSNSRVWLVLLTRVHPYTRLSVRLSVVTVSCACVLTAPCGCACGRACGCACGYGCGCGCGCGCVRVVCGCGCALTVVL